MKSNRAHTFKIWEEPDKSEIGLAGICIFLVASLAVYLL